MGISYKNDYGWQWQEAFGYTPSGYGNGGGGGSGTTATGAAGLAAGGVVAGLIGALTDYADKNFDGILNEGNKKPGLETLPNNEGGEMVLPGTPEAQLPSQTITQINDIGAVGETIAPTPQATPEIQEPDIPDKTDENVEYSINFQNYMDFLLEQQQRQWEREDAIRAETQAREDNAYQRSVEDMLRAGINPNLVGNISPAASGGGITQATGLDMSILGKQIEAESNMLLKLIEQNWKGDQNDYDRIEGYITSVLQLAGQIGMGLLIGRAKK